MMPPSRHIQKETLLKRPYFGFTKTRSLCRLNIKHLRNGYPILGRLDSLWFGEALKKYQSLQECNRWE